MELKITKERVLEAAKKCEAAKETLKTLFPEAFVQEFRIGDLIAFDGKGDRWLVLGRSEEAFKLAMSVGHKITYDPSCVYLINMETRRGDSLTHWSLGQWKVIV